MFPENVLRICFSYLGNMVGVAGIGRVFELYKYTSTIFDSFALSLPNQAARQVDWRRKQ